MNPDELAELEEERRFLLASIRDLDREHEAGDVDDADYTTLRDGYVARAAAVLREIEDGKRHLPARPARPWWRRLVLPVGVLAVGVLLGVAVAQYAGQRLPGQSLTGGQTPDAVSAALSEARQALQTGDLMSAAEKFKHVLELEPSNLEAQTYGSWLQVLVGSQGSDAELMATGVAGLEEAAAADPTYADPVCLLAVARGRFLSPPDADGAKEAGERCLAADPPADMVPMIQGMLDSL